MGAADVCVALRAASGDAMKLFAHGLAVILAASAARMYYADSVYTTMQAALFAAGVAVNLLMYALAALEG